MQEHLCRVYGMMILALLTAAGGVVMDLQFQLGGLLSAISSIGCFMWMMSTPPAEVEKRLGCFLAFAFCKGLTIGQLVAVAVYVDPAILITAFLGTSLIFACFSLSAVVAQRRSYLYLSAILSSGMSLLLLLRLVNVFARSTAMFSLELVRDLFHFNISP